MSWYIVTLEGFTVHRQTWDNMLQSDGQGDEIYIETDIHEIRGGTMLQRSGITSQTIGDRHGFPGRADIGHPSADRGLLTDDQFPYPNPWIRQGPLQDQVPPMRLWVGELQGDDSVLITLIPREWDDGSSTVNNWSQAVGANGPQIVPAVLDVIMQIRTGKSLPVNEITELVGKAMPAAARIETAIIGQPGDRPIGMKKEGSEFVFHPQPLLLSNELADLYLHNDVGYGFGIQPLPFADDDLLAGSYTLYVKITQFADQHGFVDNVLIKEQSSPAVYVTMGGAKFWIPSPLELSQYTPYMFSDVITLPDGALAGVSLIPRDGTLLRERSSAPVYVMQGGQKCWVTHAGALQQFGGWLMVRVVPDGGLAAIPEGPSVG
jgi:hypothetical protein